ncbi:MAG TPA: DUF3667 domain-containing protein [Polyangia bacterium]
MSRQLRPSPHCLNCGAAVATRFCHDCGQENTSYHASLGRLLGDLIEEVFQLESRLWRTLWTLFRRPGRLTREYNAGRRVSYTTPLRLYIVASVAYFSVAGLMPDHVRDENVRIEVPTLDAAHEQKLAQHPLLRFFYERMRESQKDPTAAVERMKRTMFDWAPRIAALLVPLFALLTWLCFRRPKRYFVEHLVFALHAHATALLLLLVAELLRWGPIGLAAFVGGVALLFLAARAVFAQSRVATALKLLAIGTIYGTFLGVCVTAVVALGFLSRG